MYNVFDTEQQARDAQEADFNLWKSLQDQTNTDYWNITTSWDTVRQRLTDNKWVYRVCESGSQSHTQEEEQSDWFPGIGA